LQDSQSACKSLSVANAVQMCGGWGLSWGSEQVHGRPQQMNRTWVGGLLIWCQKQIRLR